jgi:hypothetical protein
VVLIEAIASAFINTFGITQPTETTRRRAAWFIMFLLCVTLAVVAAGGVMLYRILHR